VELKTLESLRGTLLTLNVEREKLKNDILRAKLGLLREELKFVKKENKGES
jgi:hypothetical protein